MKREGMDPVRDFYENYYSEVFTKKGVSAYFNSITHKKLEKGSYFYPLSQNDSIDVLEIGAGQGEHLKYVKHDFNSYVLLDLFAPKEESKISDARVRWVVANICDKNLELPKFDRIISTCVFHHLDDPAAAFENIIQHLKPGGIFSLFLPSDPGILNRIVRKIFVTSTARKKGFHCYELVNAREHKNHYWSLLTELNYQFKGFEIHRRYYPLNIKHGNLSLFSIWQIKKV